MTTREEIREGINNILRQYEGSYVWELTAKIVSYLHSQRCRIEVDRELPNCLRCGNTGIVTEFRWIGPTGGNLDGRKGDRTRRQQYPCPDCEKSKVKAGYVAVEPLVKDV